MCIYIYISGSVCFVCTGVTADDGRRRGAPRVYTYRYRYR